MGGALGSPAPRAPSATPGVVRSLRVNDTVGHLPAPDSRGRRARRVSGMPAMMTERRAMRLHHSVPRSFTATLLMFAGAAFVEEARSAPTPSSNGASTHG